MNRPGRAHWRPLWLGLILLAASPALACSCSRRDDRPVDVTLSSLARYQEAYQGRLVRTQGVVRTYESSGQFWIEDSEPNRVALEPVGLVAPLLGKEVRVVGRFHFDERTGRLIHIKEIATPVPASAPPPGGH
jgi:hypothetical protein